MSGSGNILTELVLSASEDRCLDGYVVLEGENVLIYVLADASTADSHSFVIKKWRVTTINAELTAQHSVSGDATSLSIAGKYAIISVVGSLKILSRETLEPLLEVPSLSGVPTIYADSPRWIAVQIPQHHQSLRPFNGNGNDLGDAARKIVSGVYSLSRASWDTLGPYVYGPRDDVASSAAVDVPGTPAVVGGAVAVMDIISTVESGSRLSSVPPQTSLQIVCRFLAHDRGLAFMSFSPSGLLLATASESGQVVHIHSLCPSGVLSSFSSRGLILQNRHGRYDQTPQLIHKLVRGLTLSRVLSISFDNSESTVAIGTSNGTVHIFELDKINSPTLTPERVVSSEGPGSYEKTRSLSGAAGDGLSSSAGSSWTSSAPISNIDDLITQMSSQVALTGSADLANGKDNSFLRQFHSSQRIRLPYREAPLNGSAQSHLANGGKQQSSSTADSSERPPIKSSDIYQWANSSLPSASSGFSTMSTIVYRVSNRSKPFKTEIADVLELFVISSQGLLSRFRFGAANSGPLLTQNGHRYHSNGGAFGLSTASSAVPPMLLCELNRWDLLSAPSEEVDGNSASPMDISSVSGLSQQPKNGGSQDFVGLRSGSSAASKRIQNSSSSASWLPSFGDYTPSTAYGEQPLWTRPQVSYRIRVKTAASVEKEKLARPGGKKDVSTAAANSPTNFSHLFPERIASDLIGAIRPQHNGKVSARFGNEEATGIEPVSTPVSSLISGAITTEFASSGAGSSLKSGRLVASKKVGVNIRQTDQSVDLPSTDEDWQIPSNVEWEDAL